MKFETRVTRLLGIAYPVIQGGMQWVARAELVAAVSEAGGLGVLSALTFPNGEALREEIKKVKALTDRPFGVNLTLLPTLSPRPLEEYIEVALSEGVRVFETAGRNPEPYLPLLKSHGALVMHKCPSLRFAKAAERAGCDMVVVNGFEGAGHPGEGDLTSLILIQVASRWLKVPVIAAGGIVDGKGLVAALALGAEAVMMGTRFLMTKEAPVHPKVKQRLLEAKETDTVLVQRSIRSTLRVLRNRASEKVLELEREGASLEQLIPYIKGEKSREVLEKGLIDEGMVVCGQAIGLIDDLPSVKDLMERIMEEAEETLKRLKASL